MPEMLYAVQKWRNPLSLMNGCYSTKVNIQHRTNGILVIPMGIYEEYTLDLEEYDEYDIQGKLIFSDSKDLSEKWCEEDELRSGLEENIRYGYLSVAVYKDANIEICYGEKKCDPFLNDNCCFSKNHIPFILVVEKTWDDQLVCGTHYKGDRQADVYLLDNLEEVKQELRNEGISDTKGL